MRHEDRPDFIKGLTPLLPEADHSGIYAALTGTQPAKVDCEPTASRSMSVATRALTVEIQALTGSDEVCIRRIIDIQILRSTTHSLLHA